MSRKYEVEFTVTVVLTVNNDDVIERVVRETGDFENFPYCFVEGEREEAAVEMLARCCGILEEDINRLDGWADLTPDAATTKTNIVLERWKRTV